MATVRHLGLFPECPQNIEGQLATEGIWLSDNYAAASYWRVKRWEISYDISWRVFRTVSPIFDVTFNYSASLQVNVGQGTINTPYQDSFGNQLIPPYGQALTSENQLVCGENIIQYDPNNSDTAEAYMFYFVIQSGLVTSGARTSSTNMILYYDLNFLAQKEDPENKYRMPLRFTYAASQSDGGIYSGDTPPNKATQSDAFTVRMLGEEFKCDIFTEIQTSTLGGSSVQNMAVVLEAIEYWPYDPNDGLGPIYDSATGEQLRPFPA
jgi:hypothetical protein